MNESLNSMALYGRQSQKAWGDSDSVLGTLIDNLPDVVAIVDRSGAVQFANRSWQGADESAATDPLGIEFVAPEYREACRHTLDQTFETSLPQSIQLQDVFGHWWLGRAVPIAAGGEAACAILIGTDITQERLATEAVAKEQKLLRHLLELHERERRLTAYEIHDGFAQQLAGALFRLQGFRESQNRDPARAWGDFDSGLRLVGRALDETRRLISRLQPPILEESGVVDAIEYLVCERRSADGPEIEFVHDVAFDRLTPPLEIAAFRIVQEAMQNACQHSGSSKIRIELVQRDDCLRIVIRDWGTGFSTEKIDEQRFGLRGIRERAQTGRWARRHRLCQGPRHADHRRTAAGRQHSQRQRDRLQRTVSGITGEGTVVFFRR